ncbi:unnamed protein product [Arabidopsis lyrata]|nr:unnamed protein product [Arabidopsis lyrata]
MLRKNKKREDVMAPPMTLPCELEEEILSRLPPLSLARFRSVCKQWNAICNENRFINNHFARARPQFIFITNSNIYSIEIISLDGVDPTIKLRELPSSRTAYRELYLDYITITTCDGLLFCNYSDYPKVTALWNPWLKQVKWIECNDKYFDVSGVGYDNTRPEKVYKILGSFISGCKVERVAIYECASHAFKSIDSSNEQCPLSQVKRFSVSLNGNLYWRTRIPHTLDFYIRSFDFSRDIFKHFCLLPCRENHFRDVLVLGVYKGDRLSLLKQCYVTRSVEIWVTKKKIDSNNNGTDEVVWIKLLTLPTNNLPNLYNKCYGISYFIYDKTTLIMCCGEDDGGTRAFIYILSGEICSRRFQLILGFSGVVTVFMLRILSRFL